MRTYVVLADGKKNSLRNQLLIYPENKVILFTRNFTSYLSQNVYELYKLRHNIVLNQLYKRPGIRNNRST